MKPETLKIYKNNNHGTSKQIVTFLKSPGTAPRLMPIHTWLLVVFLLRQVSWDYSLSDDDVFRVRSAPRKLFGRRLSSLGVVGGGERISHVKKQTSNKQLY